MSDGGVHDTKLVKGTKPHYYGALRMRVHGGFQNLLSPTM